MQAGQVPLSDPGGSGSDLQPTPPREALLVCSAPGTLQRRAAALSSGSALLGVRSAGGGTPRVVEPVWSQRSAWEQRLARRGRREKASSKGEASSHAARASSSPRSGQLTGSPKGLGARSPLPLQFPFPFLTDPRAGARPLALQPSTFLPLTLFSSQGDFAATFWLSKALRTLPLLA